MTLLSRGWRGPLLSASTYVGAVVAVNVGFSLAPDLDWLWSLVVGGVLVLRDAAQRHWGHGVLGWMVLAAALSYRLGSPSVALASATAFMVSETVDWVAYTTTHRPFADRVWRSSLASAPVDTATFLHLAQIWSWHLFVIGVLSKASVGCLIAVVLHRQRRGVSV